MLLTQKIHPGIRAHPHRSNLKKVIPLVNHEKTRCRSKCHETVSCDISGLNIFYFWYD